MAVYGMRTPGRLVEGQNVVQANGGECQANNGRLVDVLAADGTRYRQLSGQTLEFILFHATSLLS